MTFQGQGRTRHLRLIIGRPCHPRSKLFQVIVVEGAFNPGAQIDSGTTDGGGHLDLQGSVDLGMDLPQPDDANYPGGAKIWLVLSNDYNAASNSLESWNPTEYLFENNLITYNDTDS